MNFVLLSDRSDHSHGSDHMETRLNKIIISNPVLTTNVQQFFFHTNVMRKLLIRSKVFFRSE